MIRPGLERVVRLYRPRSWYPLCIHVAGTNGKGSICAYVHQILLDAGLFVGKFTSPHLLDRRDSISIGGEVISQSQFDSIYEKFERRSVRNSIGATPFEILTATAFKAFRDAECRVAVIECGMGGGKDATNMIPKQQKLATVIAKVGLDHQEFLGDNIEDIAKEKCGIFAQDTPVIFDDTNPSNVLRVIRQEAHRAQAPIYYPWDKVHFGDGLQDGSHAQFNDDKLIPLLENSKVNEVPYQVTNAKIAMRVAWRALAGQRNIEGVEKLPVPTPEIMLQSILRTDLRGRFQSLNLQPILNVDRTMILDGAHNPQAVQASAPAVEKLRSDRRNRGSISWIFAFSQGKPLDEMLMPLVRPGDTVATVEFGPVDGMPWKHPMPSKEIAECLESVQKAGIELTAQDFGGDIRSALEWSCAQSANNAIVGIGSLYLVSDILRMHRSSLEDSN